MAAPSSSARPAAPLDDAVRAAREALRERAVPAPRAVLWMATGVGLLAERMETPREVPLGDVPGVPEPWRGTRLLVGTLGPLAAWAFDDASGEPADEPGPPWTRGFPVWLAAASGAELAVVCAAGGALPAEGGEPLPVGAFALARDHLNASGTTPLLGLGESALGPLFPDQTRLHHAGLRDAALGRARALGLRAEEAVVACTLGPSIETPAERRMLARLGAEVCVQGLATPLLAAAHAGLRVLAPCAVVESGEGPARVRDLVAAAGRAEPALEDLLVALAPDLARVADALAAEDAP